MTTICCDSFPSCWYIPTPFTLSSVAVSFKFVVSFWSLVRLMGEDTTLGFISLCFELNTSVSEFCLFKTVWTAFIITCWASSNFAKFPFITFSSACSDDLTLLFILLASSLSILFFSCSCSNILTRCSSNLLLHTPEQYCIW